MRASLIPLLLGALFTNAPAADAEGQDAGLLSRNVAVGGNSYGYQVYVPASLRGQKNPPVILFLHGIGQRGAGGYVPRQGAGAALVRQYLERVPAIILLPQCDARFYWNDPEMERMTLAALDQTVREFGADARRLYLAGVSMGGYGAWHLSSRHADKFAAVVSICGGSPVASGERFATVARGVGRTPVWVFHGSEDKIVPVGESRRMVEALKKVEGSRVRYRVRGHRPQRVDERAGRVGVDAVAARAAARLAAGPERGGRRATGRLPGGRAVEIDALD